MAPPCRHASRPKQRQPKEPFHAAWTGGPPVTRTVIVPTHVGEVAVTLKAPTDVEDPGDFDPSLDLLAAFRELEDADALDDLEVLSALEDELLRRFQGSAEGRSLAEITFIPVIMDLAVCELGLNLVSLDPEDLDKLLFDIFPSEVDALASEAKALVTELRALYSFMGRELGLPQAERFLRVLSGDTVEQLELTLSSPKKSRKAGSGLMAEGAAGSDMEQEQKIASQLRQVQAAPQTAAAPSAAGARGGP